MIKRKEKYKERARIIKLYGVSSLKIIIVLLVIQFNSMFYTYAGWYEEPLAIERTNFDNMWWLSKKKKASLREKEEDEIAKKREEYKNRSFKDKNIRWLYDDNNITRYPRSKWEVIDEDNDGIAYEYYFDKNGYLLIDTVTPDYEIVDSKGRRLDRNLKPIIHDIRENKKSIDEAIIEKSYEIGKISSPSIIIGKGVVFREKVKIYDNSINKNAITYISDSSGLTKDIKGTTIDNVKWKKCSRIRCSDGYIVLNNPSNNFNKISFTLALSYYTDVKEEDIYKLVAYDEDEYEKRKKNNTLYDAKEIYNGNINNKENQKIEFTFNKSINSLRIQIETLSGRKSRNLLIKDIKYGFSKIAYKDEIIEKRELEEEIEELKRHGIYDDILYSLNFIDEDGEEVEDEESDNDKWSKNDDYDDSTISYEDKIRDRTTGPAFDEALKSETSYREYGPAFIKIASQSNFNN